MISVLRIIPLLWEGAHVTSAWERPTLLPASCMATASDRVGDRTAEVVVVQEKRCDSDNELVHLSGQLSNPRQELRQLFDECPSP